MPASWRPSRPGQALDEILALAGTDRMTIPPNFLEMLMNTADVIPRNLEPIAAGMSGRNLLADAMPMRNIT